MPPIKINGHNVLDINGIEFSPGPPESITLSDTMQYALSILTAATNHDRRLLRCNELGALLVGNAWDNMAVVENDILLPSSGVADSFSPDGSNQGCLISTGEELVTITFTRVSGGTEEAFYVPADSLYFYPFHIIAVTAAPVPLNGGSSTYVGVTMLR